jgi:hypothetical protein
MMGFQATTSRRWITRDEIADILDAEADRLQLTYGKQSAYLPSGELMKNLAQIQLRRTQAAGLREIDNLSNDIGNRVP